MGGFGAVDDGGIGRRLWVKSRNKSIFAVYTPFIVCVASSKLDHQSFLHCFSQHHLFLQASVKAFYMAEDCAEDDDEKSMIVSLRKRALQQIRMYSTILQERGFELPKENTFNVATAKYTDFLLATASGKTVGGFLDKIATPFERTKLASYAIAAITPSLRIHACLSKEIQALLDPNESNHIYKKWISSQKFEAAATQIEELLEKLTISLTGEELEVVEKIYDQAVKLEVDFLSAQPIIEQAIVPLSRAGCHSESNAMIFCDFDIACSAIDSSAFLAEIAIMKASKVNNNLNNLKSTWSSLTSQYVEGYEQCIESMMLGEPAKVFNYESLSEALDQLSDFEKRAKSKVVKSGVLKGLHMEDIKWAGGHLVFQDGCLDFFQAIEKNNGFETDVHILSYGWSGDLIKSAFSSGKNLHVSNVSSNELLYDGPTTNGDMLTKVETPKEKLRAFNDIRKGCSEQDEKLSVYIGGSVGDLLCLLEADVGIVISPSKNLKRLGSHFGITFVPLFSGVVKKQRELVEGGSLYWNGWSGIVYTVSSWAEIHALILGA